MENRSFFRNIFRGVGNKLRMLSDNPYKKVNLNWATLKYYKHLPPGKLRTHLLFGKSLYFYSAPELLHGLDEIFLDEVYKQDLGPDPYIIDCGANIGLSIIYLKNRYPGAEILAFEPDEKNFELLTKNVQSFGFTSVTLCKEAIWTENTTLNFSNEGTMGSRIEDGPANHSGKVQAIRLKNRLNRQVDFLKIDIEGAEYKVLLDISEKLGQIKNMFVEYHGSFEQNAELTELLGMILRSGFHYYIKEATEVYKTPFLRVRNPKIPYDVQLNIFCFRASVPG